MRKCDVCKDSIVICSILFVIIFTYILLYYNKTDICASENNSVVRNVDDNCFDEYGLEYRLENNTDIKTASVVGYTYNGIYCDFSPGCMIIPDYVCFEGVNYIVDTVDMSSFAGDTHIDILRLSDSVNGLYNTESNSINIKILYIGASFSMTDKQYFYNWKNLESIIVSEDNKELASRQGVLLDKKLNTIIACPVNRTDRNFVPPDSVYAIGNNAFRYCTINYVALNNIKLIGERAFYECGNLENFELNDHTVIEGKAFYYCKSLTCIYIPGDCRINGGAFGYCDNIEVVAIGEGDGIGKSLNSPGNGEFFNCLNIRKISLPETMTEIYGFANWQDDVNYGSVDIYIPWNIRYVDNVFCSVISGNHRTGVVYHTNWSINGKYNGGNEPCRVYEYAGKTGAHIKEVTGISSKYSIAFQDDTSILTGKERYRDSFVLSDISMFTNVYHTKTEEMVTVEKKQPCAVTGSPGADDIYNNEYSEVRYVNGISVPISKPVPKNSRVQVFVAGYCNTKETKMYFTDKYGERVSTYGRFYNSANGLSSVIIDVNSEASNLCWTEIYAGLNISKIRCYSIFVRTIACIGNAGNNTVSSEVKEDIYTLDNSMMCYLNSFLIPVGKYSVNTDNTKTYAWINSYSEYYKGVKLKSKEPVNLSDFKYMVLDIAGSQTYDIYIGDGYGVDDEGEMKCGVYRECSVPAVIPLEDMAVDGMDYSSVISVSCAPCNKSIADSLVVSSVMFCRNEEDIPASFKVQAPLPTADVPEATSPPIVTTKPEENPEVTMQPTEIPEVTMQPTDMPQHNIHPTTVPIETMHPTVVPTDAYDVSGVPETVLRTDVSSKSGTSVKNGNKQQLIKPVIAVSKGITVSGIRYVKIRLKKYSGKYIEIYVNKGGKYQKIKLGNNKYTKLREYKLKYNGGKAKLRIKVRTYQISGGRKRYSSYSKTGIIRM